MGKKNRLRLGANPLDWIKPTGGESHQPDAAVVEGAGGGRQEKPEAAPPPSWPAAGPRQEAETLERIEILRRVKNRQISLEQGMELIRQFHGGKRETMGFQVCWKESSLGVKEIRPAPEDRYILFDTDRGLFNLLGGGKVERGVGGSGRESRAVIVKPGKKYLESDDNTYEIDYRDRGNYTRLVESLGRRGFEGARIIHRWACDRTLGDLNLDEHLARGIYAVFYLSQALLERKQWHMVRLLYLYPWPGDGQGGHYAAPAVHAAVSGFSRSLRRENPGFIYKTLGIRGEGVLRLEELLAEFARERENEIEIRCDLSVSTPKRREVKYLEENKTFSTGAAMDREHLPLREKGVYLITGGLGGLGRIVAQYLAEQVKARLILIGRSGLNAEKRALIGKLEASGAEVAYHQADVSRRPEVEGVIREARHRFNEINGIIHSAGETRDAFILKKTPGEMESVLAAKVYGTLNLDEVSSAEPLDFFVMFSSTAAVLGNTGQSDYAYANSFMDHFAWIREAMREKQQRKGKSLSIGWSLWQDGGMKISPPDLQLLSRQTGIEPIPTREGIEAFAKSLGDPVTSPQCIVVYGRASQYRRLFIPESAGAETTGSRKNGGSPHPGTLDLSLLLAKTEAYLKKIMAEGIKLPAEKIDSNVGFEEYGIDSIIIQQFNARIEKEFGSLPKTLLFEHRNMGELARYFVQRHRSRLMDFFGLPENGPKRENPITGPGEIKERLQGKEKGTEGRSGEAGGIAIIGVGGSYPGAVGIEEFWQNLKAGKDCITEIPNERWDLRSYYDPDPARAKEGKIYCKWGGFLGGVDKFDSIFFNISPKEAEIMDPQERKFLETVWQTLEDAGYTRNELSRPRQGEGAERVGVFVGVTTHTYQLLGVEERFKGNFVLPDSSPWSIANRVSYIFNFQGPSMPVDTACSSSLTALHLACESLEKGECGLAIAGGVNMYLHPAKYMGMCTLEMLSATGKCRAFGEGSDGFIPGEGVGAVLLKPLAKAVRDGDHIYAVIKGSALNHGGRTNGYTVPDPNAQARLILQALRNAGVDPDTIGYIEAHGTGTPLGDPIEIAGLTKAFRESTPRKQYCPIGSVKSNIGHLEAAAGIAGVTKVLLQLEHKRLVPSLHASKPNPNIDFDDTPFYIQQELAEWKPLVQKEQGQEKRIPRRAGISSFGAGGSNAHLILEEYDNPPAQASDSGEGPYLIVLSARDEERLKAYAGKLSEGIIKAENQNTLAEIAYTLQVGREAMEERLAIIVRDKQEIERKLSGYRRGNGDSESVYTGNIKGDRGKSHLLNDDGETREIVARCIHKGNYAKIARLWVEGVEIDWKLLYPGQAPRRISLPTYPFAGERCWLSTAGPGETSTAIPCASETGIHCPLYYRGEWERSPQGSPIEEKPTIKIAGPILIFQQNENGDWLQTLKKQIQGESGNPEEVIVVKAGQRFKSLSQGEYEINPRHRDDLWELFRLLESRGLLPVQLLFFWASPAEAVGDTNLPADAGTALSGSIYTIYYLLGAFAKPASSQRLKRFTCFFYRETGNHDPFIESVSGYTRSLDFVYSHLYFSTVDVWGGKREEVRNQELKPLVEAVLGELSRETARDETEIRWEEGQRYIKKVKPLTIAPARGSRLKKGGVYLITGGNGGLGLIFSRYLVERYQTLLVLTGRTPLDRQQQKNLQEQVGSPGVLYLQADAADKEAMEGVIRRIKQEYGVLNGVIHAAGTVSERLIIDKDQEEFAGVLKAKIEGTIILDRVTAEERLDFFVMFSSAAAILGDFGQCDYAIGNRFMDGFSRWREALRERKERRGQTMAIDWPLWKEGGMHLDAGGESLYLQSSGLTPLETQVGLKAFEDLLASGHCQVLVLTGDKTRIRQFLTAGEEPGESPPTSHLGETWEDIARIASGIIKMDPRKMEADENFGRYGFDSLSLKEFALQLGKTYGIEVSPALFFKHSTIGALAEYLQEEYRKEIGGYYSDGKKPGTRPVGKPGVSPGKALPSIPYPTRDFTSLKAAGVRQRPGDIAIIGAGGIFPGSGNLEEFWHHLREGKDLITEIPADRWNWQDYGVETGSGTGTGKTVKIRWGGFINDVDKFDAKFFNISPREAELMDPQNRLLLQTVWKTIEDAGYRVSALSGQAVGVFIGVQFDDYRELLMKAGKSEAQVGTGNSQAMLSNRVSYMFNFHGPSESMDTACSGSLVAVNRAVRAIRARECELAIAGGVSLILSPSNMLAAGRLGVLSPDGRCKTFDQQANGYVKGEGVGTILLKPLDKAAADGDHIYAVIKGVAVNHGGKANSLTAPNPGAQAALLVAAYEEAGFTPESITYIETHGTGTSLGDPVEFEGLKSAFQELDRKRGKTLQQNNYCGLGSVKTNIGHLEPASGIAGLLKVLLAMKHRTLPATLHLGQMNPYIHLEGTPFYVTDKTRPWQRQRDESGNPLPLRAGISSFGFGGANAHVVLEEYEASSTGPVPPDQEPQLIVLSANSEEQLRQYARELMDFLQDRDTGLPAAAGQEPSLSVCTHDLLKTAAAILAVHENTIDIDEPLSECGFDPVLLTELARQLKGKYSREITLEVMMAYSSIGALAGYLTRGGAADPTAGRNSGQPPVPFSYLAYTLQVGREPMNERLAVSAATAGELVEQLKLYCQGETTGENLFRGSVKKMETPADLLIEGREGREFIRIIMEEKKLSKLARLWVSGVEIDWKELYPGQAPHRISLPTYPFSRQRYWIPAGENRPSAAAGSNGPGPRLHPLVHCNTSTLAEQEFTTRLGGHEFYLQDHVVAGQKVLPAVIYIEMARAAGELAGQAKVRKIRNLVWTRPITASEEPLDIHIGLYPENGAVEFQVTTQKEAAPPIIHAQGKLVYEYQVLDREEPIVRAVDISAIRARCRHRREGADCYRVFRAAGLEYGPGFQALQELYYDETEALSHLRLPANQEADFTGFVLHPSLLDAALQTVIGLGHPGEAGPGTPYLPFSLGEVEVFRELPRECYVYAVSAENPGRSSTRIDKFDIQLIDSNGQLLVRIKDFTVREFKGNPLREPQPVEPESEEEAAGETLYYLSGWEETQIDIHQQQVKASSPGGVLVFTEDETFGSALQERLDRKNGTPAPVILVKPGSRYLHRENRVYEIQPGSKADYHRLLSELKDLHIIPRQIIYRWAEPGVTGSETLIHHHLERSIYSLLNLSQALMEQVPGEKIRLLYLYHKRESDSPLLYALHAAVSGFARTIRLENSKLSFRTVEIQNHEAGEEDAAAKNEILDRVIDELVRENGTAVRWEGNRRQVSRLREMDREKGGETPLPWKTNGVYLITGGLGGLGLLLAGYLTRQQGVRVVLTDRHPLNAEREARIKALEDAGSQVIYLPADISKADEVKNLVTDIKTRYKEINGIIHCAGVNRDAYVRHKTREEVEAVLAPKVYGTIYLDEATRDENLDFFLLFSSTAAVLGNPGQSDYAYANSFMDHFARERERLRAARQRTGQTLAINWSLWQEGGMKVHQHTETLMKRVMGIKPLAADSGIKAISEGLRLAIPQLVVIRGTAAKIRQTMTSLQGEPGRAPGNISIRQIDNDKDLSTCFQQDLVKIAAAILKIQEKDLDLDEDLQTYGFDSITFTELANKINETYNLEITPTVFFELDRPTLGALVLYLQEEFKEILWEYYRESRPPIFSSRIQEEPAFAAPGKPVRERRRYLEAPLPGESPAESKQSLVAIIGMSGVMPQAENLDTFWRHLQQGKDLIGEVPPSRWDWKTQGGGSGSARWGGFMEDIDKFDPVFFGISPREAESMDPQQRIFLQTVWKTLEDAGYKASALAGMKVGVFVGAGTTDYYEIWRAGSIPIDAYAGTGMAHSILANRISYLLDLRGPSESIDTACSSSLVALHRAVEAIRSGNCELAIAGGINLLITPTLFQAFAAAGMLSPDGRCKTFDKQADGYTRGEGAGSLLLKPLHRAEADGDHIYALIAGMAVNHGGRANSLTAPNATAQAELLIEAYERAHLPVHTIGYIEAHGTGTRLGDPVEFNGLKKAFTRLYQLQGKALPGKPHCGLGSVKTNIGHLEAASGIAGVIKVLLAMKHQQIPATVHFRETNPYIQLQDTPFYIVKETQAWEPVLDENGMPFPRRAGVSSFGFGGTNAHVILEEWPGPKKNKTGAQRPGNLEPGEETAPRLILLSAKNEERLREYARHLAGFLAQEQLSLTDPGLPGPMAPGTRLTDIAYTLQVGRESMETRLAVMVDRIPGLIEKLNRYARGDRDIDQLYTGTVNPEHPQWAHLLDEEIKTYLTQRLMQSRDPRKLAQLWLSGLEIDWKQLYPQGWPSRISLPTYPFEKKRYWFDSYREGSREAAAAPISKPDPSSPHRKLVLSPLTPGESRPEAKTGQEKTAAPAILKDRIKEKIQEQLSNILHLERSRLIDTVPMQEFGLDSIGTVELINGLNNEFQTDLRAVAVYDCPTVSQLAEYLLPRVKIGSVETSEAPSTRVTLGKINPQPRILLKQEEAGKKPQEECAGGMDIAIIGMAGRFPGAGDVRKFWENLKQGVDSITEVPRWRWDVNRYYDPDFQAVGKTYCKWGGFIEEVDCFDPLFFRISPSEAEVIDPQQRLFLEECIKALEDAGYAGESLSGKKCGVFVGISNNNDYATLLQESCCHENPGHAMLGGANSILASRISYFLNLKGPAIAIDTACSSSLLAIHLAYKSLQTHDIEMALAGGVLLHLHQKRFIMTSKSGALSPHGRCRTFDNGADGYVPGEGLGVIVMKPLAKAIEEKDHIYGIIKGSGINQDGTTNGITAPSAQSQKELELEVYRNYHLDPGAITFVEAHGTGTKLGDPIEVTALTEAFRHYTARKQYCAIGSVKTNIGHLAAAAGVASVIKVLLALEHKQIPPTLHFRQPNEHIPFKETPFYVNTQLQEWIVEGDRPRRAAVSAFGLSGTNCHLVLEEPPQIKKTTTLSILPYFIIPLSTKTPGALNRKRADLAAWLEKEGQRHHLADIGYTLLVGRSRYEYRWASVVRDKDQLLQALREKDETSSPEPTRSHPPDMPDPGRKEIGNRLLRELSPQQPSPPEPELPGVYKEKLRSLADLFLEGCDLEWDPLFQGCDVSRISLPTYPFNRESCWLRERNDTDREQETPAPAGETGKTTRLHPFIDANISTFEQQKFRIRLRGDEFYLSHHIIDEQKVFPAVAYVEAARAAAELAAEKTVIKLKNVVFAQPIRVEKSPRDVVISLSPTDEGANFKITTTETGRDIEHAQGTVIYQKENPVLVHGPRESRVMDIEAIKTRCSNSLNPTAIYDLFRQVGVKYGPAFQTIQELFFNDSESLSKLQLPGTLQAGFHDFVLHPSFLDGVLQTTIGIALGDKSRQEGTNYLPFVLAEIEMIKPMTEVCYAYATRSGISSTASARVMKFNIQLLDETGDLLVRLRDFSVRAVTDLQTSAPAVDKRQITQEDQAPAVAYYREKWQKSAFELSPLPVGAGTGPLLIFDTGSALVEILRHEGAGPGTEAMPSILVTPGTQFRDNGNHTYEIDPTHHQDYSQLLQTLAEKRMIPGTIIHRWSQELLTGNDNTFTRLLDRGIYSLFYLVKALIGLGYKEGMRLLYLYSNSRTRPQPQYAAVSGFAKTVHRENPGLLLKIVEIDSPPPAPSETADTRLAEVIKVELGAQDSEEVRWEGKDRYTRCLEAFDPGKEAAGGKNIEAAVKLREGAVVLITGGAGALGFRFALHLAKTGNPHLVLTGRSKLNREIEGQLRQLKDAGAEAIYIQSDISNRDQVKKLAADIKTRYKQVDGVIHSAGVIRDAYLHTKTKEDFDAVLAPKVWGTLYLDEVLEEEKLDFFVMFSAIAPVWGNPGQADYAYANSFMDHFSGVRENLRAEGKRYGKTLSLNWPLWQEGGMRLDERLLTMVRSSGLSPLPTAAGIEVWEKALASKATRWIVTYGDRRKLEQLHTPASIQADQPSPKQPAPAAPGTAHPSPSPLQEENPRLARIQADLVKIIARQLKLKEQTIDPQKNLKDYGYDSINLTILANRINETYWLDMTPAIFFELEKLTVEASARYLWEAYNRQMTAYYGIKDPGCDPAVKENPAPCPTPPPPSLDTDSPGGEEIAIIGMAGRMPRADHLEEFWKYLEAGENLVTEIPPDRWDWRLYDGDPLKEENKTVSRWGGFMNRVDTFDAKFFDISPREAELMDPQQRIFLETVWETIEDAGYRATALAGTRTGLFVGVSTSDYGQLLMGCGTGLQAQAATGLSHSMIANRVSYLLDLRGPCESINTACSSSLAALQRGVESIRSGNCQMAIAGGINVLLSPMSHIAFGKVGVLSDDGACKAFDKDANGIVRGEGSGAVLLKPLGKAVQEGDHIYAIIKGVGENHGGRSSSLTAPNPNAQAQLIVEVYERANIDPETVTYIECHGTGTRLGDPVEINGLKNAFTQLYQKWGKPVPPANTCGIGSVKTNIGHLEAAAGIAGLFKVLLALKHKKIPANIHFREPNPYMDLKNSPFYVVEKTCPWEPLTDGPHPGIPLRAGVSSFGLGGTNVHIVLEEYRAENPLPPPIQETVPQVILLSAKEDERLKEAAGKMVMFLETIKHESFRETEPAAPGISLMEMAYTLQVGREPMSERLAVVCSDFRELQDKLQRFHQGEGEIPGVYRGSTVDSREKIERLIDGPAGAEFVRKVMENREQGKLARLWVMGVDIDWKLSYPQGTPRRIALPTYSFARDRYWLPAADKSQFPSEAVPPTAAVEPDPLKNFFYIPKWTPAALSPLPSDSIPKDQPGTPGEREKSTILLVYPGDSNNLEIARALSDTHNSENLVEIKLGTETRQYANHCWEVEAGEPRAWQSCIAQLKRIDLIYFLGLGRGGENLGNDGDQWEQSQEYGVFSLFRLFKALSRREFTRHPLRVKVITNNVHQVQPGDKIIPYAGSLLGFTRSMAREYPHMEISGIDLGIDSGEPGVGPGRPGEKTREIVEAILAEPGHQRGEIVAIRKGQRYVQELEPLRLAPAVGTPFRQGGVYLILGGAGGIGLELSRYLSRSVQARIVLLGRSPLEEERQEKISHLQAGGGEVLYIQADATDEQSMKTAVKKAKARFGAIHGVIHSALVLKDKTLENMDEETLRTVLAPKVRGSVVLSKVLRDEPLDFMVFFSSAASFTANAGRGSYTAACTFEDAFALHLRQQKSYPVKVINWGYWGSVGVAAGEKMKELFAARGIQPIEPQEGIEAITRILSHGEPQVAAVKRENNLAGSSLSPKKIPKEDPRNPRHPLEKKSTQTPLAFIEDRIGEILSRILKTPRSRFDVDAPFTRFGVDSVLAIEIVYRINEELGIELRQTDLFNYSTLRQLLRHIENNFKPLHDGIGAPHSLENNGTGLPDPREEKTRSLLLKLKQGELDAQTVNRQIESIWQ